MHLLTCRQTRDSQTQRQSDLLDIEQRWLPKFFNHLPKASTLTCHHDSFHLQADSWFPESEGELLDMVQRWVVAYSRSLQSHLREDGNVEAELQVCSMWR